MRPNKIQFESMLLKSHPASPSKGDPLRRSFPKQQTYGLTARPRATPMNLSSKVYFTYILTPSRAPYSIWGGKIGEFPNLKKRMFVVDITKRWGKSITEERDMTVMKV